jgi:hypothetical protein
MVDVWDKAAELINKVPDVWIIDPHKLKKRAVYRFRGGKRERLVLRLPNTPTVIRLLEVGK